MMTSDPDPAVRWRAIVAFYTEFAAETQWEYLQPMVGLAEWVAAQPMAARLYPGTSHEWLVVQLRPGYQPEAPGFSIGVRRDRQLECVLWARVGHRLRSWVGRMEQAHAVFGEFVDHLEALAPDESKTPTRGTPGAPSGSDRPAAVAAEPFAAGRGFRPSNRSPSDARD